MMAIIRTGGKQYLVTPGQEITIETLPIAPGKPVSFEQIFMVSDEGATKFGNPVVAGAKVTGTVLEHGRGEKVVGIKFHNKVRYRRKFGHRQPFTKVKIEKIV